MRVYNTISDIISEGMYISSPNVLQIKSDKSEAVCCSVFDNDLRGNMERLERDRRPEDDRRLDQMLDLIQSTVLEDERVCHKYTI